MSSKNQKTNEKQGEPAIFRRENMGDERFTEIHGTLTADEHGNPVFIDNEMTFKITLKTVEK